MNVSIVCPFAFNTCALQKNRAGDILVPRALEEDVAAGDRSIEESRMPEGFRNDCPSRCNREINDDR